jgi:hypothetical protein
MALSPDGYPGRRPGAVRPFFLVATRKAISAEKVMVGYYIWGMERSQTLDAFVPILGDGIKYMGYYPRQRCALNLGAFADALSENEKFSTYDNQFGHSPRVAAEALRRAARGAACRCDGASGEAR